MKNTYETYQEAKIANPNADILVSNVGKFHAVKESPTSHFANGWELCNPDDHCMTVEKFLANGYKFVGGDIYMFSDGFVNTVRNPENKPAMGDSSRYILRAAALKTEHQQEMEELKPKRTKAEFERVEFGYAWEAVKYREEQQDYLFRDAKSDLPDGPLYVQILNLSDVVINHKKNNLYRKVEVEIDEESFVMNALIDTPQDAPYVEFHGSAMTIDGAISIKQMRAITDALDDNGKFK